MIIVMPMGKRNTLGRIFERDARGIELGGHDVL